MLRSQRRRILRRGRRGSLPKLTSWKYLGIALRLLLRCKLPVDDRNFFFAVIDGSTLCAGLNRRNATTSVSDFAVWDDC